ncbi:MAG: diflavin flavoprotein [Cyanobacteriota bacterium]|nr:diflavin flavoprotein [Cyanobacteriota bacterium]
MSNSNPRDMQIAPIATDTKLIKARSWTRLRFEIEYALAKGSTSNCYLIEGDKTAIIDPPPETFTHIYIEALQSVLDLQELDYVVVGHFNPNRVATLKAILERAPQITFVASVPGAANLRKAFGPHLNVIEMRGKETLDLGKGHVLKGIPIPSPRWPSGLATYDEQTQVLYSNKLFGTHVCGEEVFDEDWDILKEDQRYYFDCLMAPHAPHVKAALEKLSEVPVRMYATVHGPLVRYGLIELKKAYQQWSVSQTEREVTVALLYASAYGNTSTLAQAFGLGLTKGGVAVESINCEFADPDDIRAAIEKSDGFIIGSPTIGGNAPTPIHTALGIVLSIGDTGKLAGVFGSYGWSGEAFDLIEGKLRDAGFKFGFDTFKARFKPSDKTLKECEETATDFAQSLRKARKLRIAQPTATPMEQAVGRIVGSVCVLTAKQGEVSTGMLGSWVSQATFDPPGISLAIAKDRAVETLLYPGSKFVLNIIGEGNQQDYVKHFRKSFAPGEDRFSNFSITEADNGGIILTDAIAYLECSASKRMECGDHWVIYATVDNGKLLQSDTVTAIHRRKAGNHY